MSEDGFHIGTAWLDVLADTSGLSEDLKAKVEEARTELRIPVVADTEGLQEQVRLAAAEADSTSKVRMVVDDDSAEAFKADAEADAEAAGTSSGGKFSNAMSDAVGAAGIGAGGEAIERDAEKHAETAGEESGNRFSNMLSNVIGSVGLGNGGDKLKDSARDLGKDAGKDYGGKFGSGIMSMAGSLPVVGTAIAAAVGITAIAVDFGEKLENSQISLQDAVRNSGLSWDKYSGQVSAVGTKMAQYGYTQDQVDASMAKVVTATGSMSDALRSEGVIANIAAQQHVDLATATGIYTKSLAGNARQLKQMGIIQATGATDTAAFSSASGILAGQIQNAGGMAQFAAQHNISLAKAQELVNSASGNLAANTKILTDHNLTLAETIADVTGAQNGSSSSIAALAAHHLSLAQAEDIVKSSTTGNIDAYNKLGIEVLPKTATAQDKLNQVNAIWSSKTSGDAAAAADTFGGKLKAVEAHFEDLAETIGMKVLPVVMSIFNFLSSHIGIVETVAEVLGVALVGALLAITVNFAIATIAAMAFSTALTGGIIIAVVAAIAIFLKFHNDIIHFFEDAWDTVTHGIESAWNTITELFKKYWVLIIGIFTGPIGMLVALIVQFHEQIFDEIKTVWNSILNFFENIWNSIYDFFKGILSTVADLYVAQWMLIFDGIRDAWNDISSWFHTWWDTLYSTFQDIVTTIRSWLLGSWNNIYSDVRSVFGEIKSWFSSFWSGLQSGFQTAVNGIKSIWNTVEGIAEAPVKFIVNTVYDDGIVKVWNDIAGAVSLPKLTPVTLAEGGVLPGYAPGHDVIPAVLSPGESVLTPGATRELGASTINYLNAKHRPNVPDERSKGHFALGSLNPVSDLEHAASDVIGWSKDGIDALRNLTGDALASGISTMLKPVLNELSGVAGSTQLGSMIKAVPTALITDFTNYVKSHSGSSGSSGKYTGKYGAGVAQWKSDVDQALKMLGLPTSLDGQVLYQMQTESGGNPNAINNWDSNAAAGDPSRGLLQTIMTTFKAYAGPFADDSIYNPMANIYAAINYALHTYGPTLMRDGMGMGSGHGYASGTLSTAPGYAMVGENGPELVRFSGGQQVYSNQQTQQITADSRPPVNVNFYGTQYPNAEQIANLKMELGMSLQVTG